MINKNNPLNADVQNKTQGDGKHPDVKARIIAPYSGIMPTDASGVVTGLGENGEKATSLTDGEATTQTSSDDADVTHPQERPKSK